MLYLGADHRGFDLKEKIKKYLESVDIESTDLGAHQKDNSDDYNEHAAEVSRYVRLKGENLGIVFCGSGAGVNIVANKHAEIRCSVCCSKEMVEAARKDDAINVLAIPADFTSFDQAKEIVLAFVKTPFSMEERHVKRLEKIVKMEGEGQLS